MRMTVDFPSQKNIKQRFAETIAWCSTHALLNDPENSLRTPNLKPEDYDVWFDTTAKERVKGVEVLAARRSELLQGQDLKIDNLAAIVRKGRLVIYWPTANASDPASGVVSKGLYSEWESCPPWDTWLFHIAESASDHEYLVTWIPTIFLKLAQEGIYANPTECLSWATSDATQPFLQYLNQLGLLV
jgi:hypothetical protein